MVWTPADIVVIKVNFDALYWDELQKATKDFFHKYIVPEILTGCVRFSLPLSESQVVDAKEDSDEICVAAEISEQLQHHPHDDAGAAATCSACGLLLPEDDNSNASIGCECVCDCERWYCWPCAGFNVELSNLGIEWMCPKCVRECSSIN